MYIDKENFVAWMERIMDRLDMQDKKIDRLLSGHNYLNGEKLLDNQDLCFMLKVSTKTLQRYRKKGILPYLTLDGKYFYRASDIHKLIPVSYTHLTLRRYAVCRSRWSPYH